MLTQLLTHEAFIRPNADARSSTKTHVQASLHPDAMFDPALFGVPEGTRIPIKLQQELIKNHAKAMIHAMEHQDPHAANPPGTFAQSLYSGLNLQPSKLATGLGKGMSKFAKSVVTVPNTKPPPKGYAGMTGGGFSIPGGVSVGDLKPKLKMPSSSGVKKQMGGTATKMLNGMISSGLDMAGVG